jgi:hypothetical protein
VANPSASTSKILANMEKANLQVISAIETGSPGDSNSRRPFLQTHNNHCTWHWEQTGTTLIVENMHLFEEHQQKHYAAHFTHHQIKVNKKDVLHKIQPILHGYPITIRQSTSTTLVFARPHNTYETFNLSKPKPVSICDPYKVAMLKHIRYQPVQQHDMELIKSTQTSSASPANNGGHEQTLAGAQPIKEM